MTILRPTPAARMSHLAPYRVTPLPPRAPLPDGVIRLADAPVSAEMRERCRKLALDVVAVQVRETTRGGSAMR
jgi:hypothetical protein